jgi:hypothetical protein
MLFDLRKRGRRRTVQVIYLGLAVLFGIGFIGFGVGVGGGGGGLFNALEKSSNSSGPDYSAQVKKDQKLAAEQPQNIKAWETLIRDLYRQAGTGGYYESTTGAFTPKAKGLLTEIQRGWDRYLALHPHPPSTALANEMLGVYTGAGGLNQPASALKVMQIIVASRPPSAGLYENLAVLAYLAHNNTLGDKAAKRSVALAPEAERTLLENKLHEAKLQANPQTVQVNQKALAKQAEEALKKKGVLPQNSKVNPKVTGTQPTATTGATSTGQTGATSTGQTGATSTGPTSTGTKK